MWLVLLINLPGLGMWTSYFSLSCITCFLCSFDLRFTCFLFVILEVFLGFGALSIKIELAFDFSRYLGIFVKFTIVPRLGFFRG